MIARPMRAMDRRNRVLPILAVGALSCPASFALHSGLAAASGDCPFSKEFLRDYEEAQGAVDELRSAAPLLELLKKYDKVEERAELELSIGLAYNQRTGVVDHEKAVIHFTNALNYDLPEETYLKILLWRGNSLEALKRHDDALNDYLRGLVAISYHGLPATTPKVEPSPSPIYINSDDPANAQRLRDYQKYTRRVHLQAFMLMQRYFLVQGIKRVQAASGVSAEQVLDHIKALTPDASRIEKVRDVLKGENKRPWR